MPQPIVEAEDFLYVTSKRFPFVDKSNNLLKDSTISRVKPRLTKITQDG